MNYGYTVANSIDMINEFCDEPSKYPFWKLQEAINDAKTHYDYGNASKNWYDSVVRVLSQYT